jgi:hypothetical protein
VALGGEKFVLVIKVVVPQCEPPYSFPVLGVKPLQAWIVRFFFSSVLFVHYFSC